MAANQRITFPMSLILANERAELSHQTKLYIERWRGSILEGVPLSTADGAEALIDAMVLVQAFAEHLMHEQVYFDRQRDTLPADVEPSVVECPTCHGVGRVRDGIGVPVSLSPAGVSGPRQAEPMARLCMCCDGLGRVADPQDASAVPHTIVCSACMGVGELGHPVHP